MTESLLLHEIDRMLDQIDGELISRSRVVDDLLDMRLAAPQLPAFVRTVDVALENIPGKSTVTKDWWMTSLADLRDAAQLATVAS